MRHVLTDGSLRPAIEIEGDMDCGVRAVQHGFGISYEESYALHAEAGREPCDGIDTDNLLAGRVIAGRIATVIEDHPYDRNGNIIPGATLAAFARTNPIGHFIVRVYGRGGKRNGIFHVVAVLDGAVNDIVKISGHKRIVTVWEIRNAII